MIELKGYVDAIDGLKSITLKGVPSTLLSFVLINASKERIRVLIWVDKAKEYVGLIQLRKMVEITGGTLKESNVRFRNPNDKISLLEFNVQKPSIIKIIGDYLDNNAESTITYTPVESIDVFQAEARPIEVKGYIKCIQKMESQKSFFGSGVIVNYYHPLTFEIKDFKEDGRLQRGVPVKMKAEMDKRSGGILKVSDMENVDILEEALLSENDLRLIYKCLDNAKRQKNHN